MTDHFYTINKLGTGIYKDKGSKFLGFAYPVSNLETVQKNLEALRAEYYDARHHCYAYILGNEGNNFRANDDGEPNHSAGDPILGQMRSKNLTNTLIVVIRYFGGTKLGVSGLINAYKKAAEEALNNTSISKKPILVSIHISYSYGSTNEIMKLVDKFGLLIIDQQFEEYCSLKAHVLISKQRALLEEIQLLIDTGNEITLLN